MLPLSLLRTGQGHQIMVELKNGETYNGYLVNCDNWMNINLKNVIRTSKDSDKFWKIESCYIRGNTIKYISVPDEIIDLVAEEEQNLRTSYQPNRGDGTNNRGGRGRGGEGYSGRGRGDSSSGRGRGENSYRGRGGGDASANRGRGGDFRGGRGGNRGGGGDFRGGRGGGRGGNNNSNNNNSTTTA